MSLSHFMPAHVTETTYHGFLYDIVYHRRSLPTWQKLNIRLASVFEGFGHRRPIPIHRAFGAPRDNPKRIEVILFPGVHLSKLCSILKNLPTSLRAREVNTERKKSSCLPLWQ